MAKVIVTGGAGFIGSEIVKNLLAKGYKVRVVDNLSKNINFKQDKNVDFLNIDLTDSAKTFNSFKGMDFCINLAAKIGGIGYFHKYPATILSENNKIYSSVFEAAAKNSLQRMVYISSSMVFESANKFPSKEDDANKIPAPISAYGFSKLSGERYCHAFWDEYKLPFSICRPFNAYGVNEYPGEEVGYSHVIPDLTKKILRGHYPLELLGNGKQIRCFTHVSDLADGIVAVMESKNAVNQDFNIASSKPITMYSLAKLLWEIIGKKEKFKIKYVKGFTYDVVRRIPDVSKTKKIINWEPKIDFEKGLSEVVDWLKNEIK